MIQEQERRKQRTSVRQIKYSNTVYTNRTLLAFSNTIQHPVVEVTVLVDVNHPIGDVVYSQLSELNSHKYEDISTIRFIPILQKPLSNCHDFQCEKYRAILCGFYASPSKTEQLGFQFCVLTHHEGDVIAIMKKCSREHTIFYPIIDSCIHSPEPENLVSNMTRYAIESIQNMKDTTMEMKLAAEDESELEEEDDLVSIEIDTDLKPVSFSDETLIPSLLPLTILVNHHVIILDTPLSKHVCDAIPDSTPLVCSGIQPVLKNTPNLDIPQIDVYLHIGCKSNLQSLDGLFDWFIAYPEYVI